MAKGWYPVVDYSTCTDCGECVTFCPHGVYDTSKAPSPSVMDPLSCVDHCHGCGDLCPEGAIAYVGEDTGWRPKKGEKAPFAPDCGCGRGAGCGCSGPVETSEKGTPLKEMVVDFLYLDLDSCERCGGTDQALEDALSGIAPALEAAGYRVTLNKIEITGEEIAARHRFLSSPTIRVNGRDLCLEIRENPCGPCSGLAGTSTLCRLFVCEGKEYEVPPKAMLADALLKAAFSATAQTAPEGPYELPENLRRFFAGRKQKKNCGCGGSCC